MSVLDGNAVGQPEVFGSAGDLAFAGQGDLCDPGVICAFFPAQDEALGETGGFVGIIVPAEIHAFGNREGSAVGIEELPTGFGVLVFDSDEAFVDFADHVPCGFDDGFSLFVDEAPFLARADGEEAFGEFSGLVPISWRIFISPHFVPGACFEEGFTVFADEDGFGSGVGEEDAGVAGGHRFVIGGDEELAVESHGAPLALPDGEESEVGAEAFPTESPLGFAEEGSFAVDEGPFVVAADGSEAFGDVVEGAVPSGGCDDAAGAIDESAFFFWAGAYGDNGGAGWGEAPGVVPRAGDDEFSGGVGIAPFAEALDGDEAADEGLDGLPFGAENNPAFGIGEPPLGAAAQRKALLFGVGEDFVVGTGKDLFAGWVDEAPFAIEADCGEPGGIKGSRGLIALGGGPLPNLGGGP